MSKIVSLLVLIFFFWISGCSASLPRWVIIYRTKSPVDAECLKEILHEQSPGKSVIEEEPKLPKGEAKIYHFLAQSVEYKEPDSDLSFRFGFAILTKNERQKRLEIGFTIKKSGDQPITEKEKQSAMPKVHELQKLTQSFAKASTDRCHLSTDPDDITNDCTSFACH